MEVELSKFWRISSVLSSAFLEPLHTPSLFVLEVHILPATTALDKFKSGFKKLLSFLVWWKQHLLFTADTAVLLLFMCPYVKKNTCRFASLCEHRNQYGCTSEHQHALERQGPLLLFCCLVVYPCIQMWRNTYTCTLLFLRQISFCLTLVTHFVKGAYCCSMNWETIKSSPKASRRLFYFACIQVHFQT